MSAIRGFVQSDADGIQQQRRRLRAVGTAAAGPEQDNGWGKLDEPEGTNQSDRRRDVSARCVHVGGFESSEDAGKQIRVWQWSGGERIWIGESPAMGCGRH